MADDKKEPITQPAMPAQPRTKQLPAMTDRALLEDLFRITKSTCEEVKNVSLNVDILTTHVDTLTSRVTLVERRQDDAENRGTKHSGGLVRASATDAQHDAAIASLITEVEQVKKNQVSAAAEREATAAAIARIESQVTGFFRNPKVIAVGKVLFGIAMAYAAAKGLKVAP